jgi:serine/threonine-protein kinase
MKKKTHWIFSDLSIGIILFVLVLAFYLLNVPIFESFEYKLYDFRVKLRQSKQPLDKICLVTIDDQSITNIGRWPWPRSYIAELIDKLSSANPKVIGLNILFSEPDLNQGIQEIQGLKGKFVMLWAQLQSKIRKKDYEELTKFLDELRNSESRLDNDTILATSIANSGKVVLPMFFMIGKPLTEEQTNLSELLSSSTLTNIDDTFVSAKKTHYIEGYSPVLPFESFANSAAGIGHSNLLTDKDGVVRKETLCIYANGNYYPSFSLQLICKYLNLPLKDFRVTLGKNITFGNITVPTNNDMTMFIDYAGKPNTYQYFSVFDVLSDKIPMELFKNKIVLVGHMASGIASLYVAPVDKSFPSLEIVANALQNILDQRFITRPSYAGILEIIILIIVGIFISIILPRLKAQWGGIITFAIFIIIISIGTYLFMANGFWIKLIYPALLLIVGYTVITLKYFLLTEKKKELVETESIETNKMLGLSFQGQGMLDLAFEKFRRCPIDDAMKELLYNLGLDFERKRQLNKAVAVYEHIMTADPKYKDLETKIQQLKTAGESVTFGAGAPGAKKKSSDTVIMEGSTQAPTLGRYEIEKVLGQGAMGIVYLGKDPKINRMVAIKTLKFEDDISEEEVKKIKERFFREAESAGTLNHPNIVRIFDAGEDYDISYIAMELLEGDDLKTNCEKDKLLPIPEVIDITAKVANALDYAHQQGIVHRDIKPANIMKLKDGTIRVTDFGIARIVSSSSTQTGTVMGTPSYMSPEQIAGKKVDGRADLFSLGVFLYEMLTGEKPFKGDSIATLIFQITTEPPPEPLQFNPNIPKPLLDIITKLLQKNPDQRYQRGTELEEDLKKCLTEIQG